MKIACLLILTPLVALAQDTPDDARAREEIRILETKAAAWGALRALDLTDDEARTLLDLAKKASEAQADYEARLQKLRDQEVKALRAFREEDLRNVGFAPETERAAAQADHEESTLTKRFRDRVTELENQAPLTEQQQQMLAHFRPEDAAALFDKRAAPPLPPELQNFVGKLRRLSETEFEQQKDDLRREFAKALKPSPNPDEDVSARMKQMDAAMREIRSLPPDRVNRDVPRIARQARPKETPQRVREELQDIYQQKHGAIGPVGRLLLLPGLTEALAKRLGEKPPATPVATAGRDAG
ncbi:MAG: hypothetical protein HYY16_08470 [Planctomycetes bacterium]|nr:hypothetical protein [Planctomycetota bacterium]